MITYLEFPVLKTSESNTYSKNIKIYTSMSPYVHGEFIPSPNNYYKYLYKPSNAGIGKAQNNLKKSYILRVAGVYFIRGVYK